jgi:predicted component of viral defense system (DUF524 family)
VRLVRRDGVLAERLGDLFVLDAEHEWLLEGPPEVLSAVCDAVGAPATRLGTVVLFSFGNAVGRYRAGPLGEINVRSGKWTESHYSTMLDEISEQATSLPFQAGAAGALPFTRSELNAPEVLYHTFVWLRHVVLESNGALVGALRAITNDPHRKMSREERIVPAEFAMNMSAKAFDEVTAGVRPLRRVSSSIRLLPGGLFPIDVRETVGRPSTDTAENRFIKAFLASCQFVVQAMRGSSTAGAALSARVKADCLAIEGVLAPIARHRIWGDVGVMHTFPASSIVLQRRSAYREVLRHHMLLKMASKALPLDAAAASDLLEAKDIARLYEVWTAFEVIRAVSASKGAASHALRFRHDDLNVALRNGLLVSWSDGTEVAYNATYTQRAGWHGRSWSLQLRPDVALFVPSGNAAGLHVFDAKFRVSKSLVDLDDAADADAKTDDLQKMHTYRDAIPEVRSAWVMYPGTVFKAWGRNVEVLGGSGAPPTDAIGEIPVVPGGDGADLMGVVSTLLSQEPAG